ncbi:hypothetical protein BGZ59_004210 [Podila verticillata]|nr:hypothetical protein BGZ59_004210 [Podila verticillata]
MIMKTSFVAAVVAVMSAMVTQAHVGLKTPCSRGQPAAGCPAPPPGSSFDYDINSPIGTHDSIGKPICKNTVPYTTRKVYRAGETISTDYTVGASHGGGHCQWALSYDEGKTWVVIKTMIRECLRGVSGGDKYTIPVQIPANAPSGKATFQWIWNNAVAFAKRKAITVRAPGSGPGPAPKPTTTTKPAPKPTTTKPTKPTTPSKKPSPKPTKTTATKKPVKPTKTPTKKPAKPTKTKPTKKPTKPTKAPNHNKHKHNEYHSKHCF